MSKAPAKARRSSTSHEKLSVLGAPVEVRRHAGARRLTLRVSRTRRAVIVTLPLQCDLGEAGSFLNRNIDWVKAKWPGATRFYSHFPDPNKLTERRSMACQVLRTLGPAGRPAAPEIIRIFKDLHHIIFEYRDGDGNPRKDDLDNTEIYRLQRSHTTERSDATASAPR